MSITIPTILDTLFPAGTAHNTALPVTVVDRGANHTPASTRLSHNFGIPYKGGKSTFAFYGDFGTDPSIAIKIQAAFDGGSVYSASGTSSGALNNNNWIDLTDSQGNAVEINNSQGVVTLDIGKCMLRFVITTSDTNVTVAGSDIKLAIS